MASGLLGLLAAGPSCAIDSLGVGWRGGGGIARWTRAVAESRLVALDQDSIWTWDVRPNSNLGPGTIERGGFALIPSALSGGEATFLPGAAVLHDGDETTAFAPDDFANRFGVERTSPIFIDLGATFRVNRIRLFPRLDSEHKQLFPRAFSLATSASAEKGINLLERDFRTVFDFFPSNPNRQPIVERRFPSRDVRYIRLLVRENRRWELAETEIYSDGTLPAGEFVSVPILATQGPRPLWGKVRYDGGDIQDLPVTVQTRSGPDRTPLHYYRLTGIGSARERVSSATWTRLDSVEQGPIVRNPAWSAWETVTDGQVRSPGTMPYIQFRLLLNEPGIVIKRLIIEYLNPPIAERLESEITPLIVNAGHDTVFTVSLRTRIRRLRTDGSLLPDGDTGFQGIRIETAARITRIEKVLVDDREVEFSASYPPGTEIRLRRTVLQDGTFIQVVLRGTVFRDATRFDVQAIDRRLVDGRLLTVKQSAREQDVDPLSVGGSLVVRVKDEGGKLPLLNQIQTSGGVFTPNGDGANDAFTVSYVLLKLTQPVAAQLGIYDLGGRRIRQLAVGRVSSGSRSHVWDGRDEGRRRVLPGLYIWRLRLAADAGAVERQGVVGVAY
ncbi:MAG: gliding motility-associated C-terminal domain-containing protein [Candidatus Latescibacterota bacterium]|nr:gliding motility-associated C-terminal domain-containing protein [Candidatus Latescibacterota bacterium]